MNEMIENIVERLLKIDFLGNVGSQPVRSIGVFELEKVASCRHAIEIRSSEIASDAFSEGAGRLTRKLSADYRKEYRMWNEYARRHRESMDKELFPTVDAQVDQVLELQQVGWWPQFIKDSIRWDILHFAAEQAYSEIVPVGFYSTILQVYESGHFPCNWNEVWPNGRIAIL